MRRPWLWVVGGRWDHLAALTRALTALAILMGGIALNSYANDRSRLNGEVSSLRVRSRVDHARINQLVDTLNERGIPVPTPPTTTTSTTVRRHPPITRRPPRPRTPSTTHPPTTAHTPSTTTTTTVRTCPNQTIPVAGTCPTVP